MDNPSRAKLSLSLIPISLALTITAWAILSWPLPLHFTEGIPASPHSGAREHQVRGMFAGDHLQLMYYFELFSSKLEGRTPWFSNPYEFNIGEDSNQFFFSLEYFPFSVFYALGKTLGGSAAGYNLTILLSMWLTVLSTWLLLRRYVTDEAVIALFALVAVIFPFRWVSLFEGSPTGFAMMWVPVMVLGLDIAVREGKARGGIIAGAAILFCFLGSKQVFFFIALLAPAWCFLAFFSRKEFSWTSLSDYLSIIRGLAPAVFFSGAALYLSRLLASELADTQMGEGRHLAEVSLFSPRPEGVLTWQAMNISEQVFMGYALPILLVIGGLIIFLRWLRRPSDTWRETLIYLSICAGILLVLLLALGPHGPRAGKAFVLAREGVPFYDMLRQPGKIFAVMPTLLSLAGALSLATITRSLSTKWWRNTCVILFGVAICLEYLPLSRPTISLIDKDQPTYRAIAEHARERGIPSRMLVVVLWPGDTHYSSIYQHWALRYGIRMVNGYSPAVDRHYYEHIFQRFISLNHGYLSDDQADDLLSRGIHYIVLHEDMFPEKVSPFPVTYTLKAFLNHSRLALIQQSGPVWGFEIIDKPRFRPVKAPDWNVFFSARHWVLGLHKAVDQGEHSENSGIQVSPSRPPSVANTTYTGAPPAPDLRWMIRVRGQGQLAVETHAQNTGRIFAEDKYIDETEWTWIESRIPLETFQTIMLRILLFQGELHVDSALLTAGEWNSIALGETVVLPAPLFFHAGYTNLDRNTVVFRRTHEDARILFYGPKLPLAPGRYQISMHFNSPAEKGTELGVLNLEYDWQTGKGVTVPVIAGSPAIGSVTLENNLPFNLAFIYFAKEDMEIEKVLITREE